MENNNEQIINQAPEMLEIVGINFREAGKIYYFAPNGIKFAEGDRVIVDTARDILAELRSKKDEKVEQF